MPLTEPLIWPDFLDFIQNLHNYTYIHINTTDTQLLHKKKLSYNDYK
jgi:hypothetical protein